MENKIYFKNFEADPNTQVMAETLLERVADVAPYSSSIIGAVEKTDKEFCASIDIYFNGGAFFASAQDKNLQRALWRVEKKICNKIDQWKGHRFGHHAISGFFGNCKYRGLIRA